MVARRKRRSKPRYIKRPDSCELFTVLLATGRFMLFSIILFLGYIVDIVEAFDADGDDLTFRIIDDVINEILVLMPVPGRSNAVHVVLAKQVDREASGHLTQAAKVGY